MKKLSQQADKTTQAIDLAFQALLAEYTAIRDASLSRDQILGGLENLLMIILSATVVSIPEIINRQLFIVLPVLSLFLSGIVFARLNQSRLNWELAQYEKDVLRKNLSDFFRITGSSMIVDFVENLWQWQAFHRNQLRKGFFLSRIIRLPMNIGMEPFLLLVSVGVLGLFVYLRGLYGGTTLELVIFVIACFYFAWLVLTYVEFVLWLNSVIARNKS